MKSQSVAYMRGEAVDEEKGVEATVTDLFVKEKSSGDITGTESIDQSEVIFIVEDIQRGDGGFISDIAERGGGYLVEDREGIAHRTVGFAGDDIERGTVG